MRICILEDRYDGSDSPMALYDPPSSPELYFGRHDWERHFVTKMNGVGRVIELSRSDFDVFVNLCDGAWEEDRPGIEIVQTLQRLNVPFTGADANFYDPSREVMKRVAHYCGIRTPRGVFADRADDVQRALDTLRFPLIVKHPNSYSSIGITPDSRVDTPDDLRLQSARTIEGFGAALIEEFVDGPEFTVLVAENPDDASNPIAYQPVEFRFPEGESFKHFDMKWKTYEGMSAVPVDDRNELAERLKRMSIDFFVGLRGSGYGRCDIRMDADGELYMLEINPNCGVFYGSDQGGSADLILQFDPRGYAHFVETILQSAFNRVAAPRKWKPRLDGQSGYGVVADRDIASGELIESYEEAPHVLVTRTHVEANWDEERRRAFAQYAYPLTDEVYATWSDDPEEWRPVNHSCDPNAWLDRLNLVARRPIAEGEEITMDYATFCNEMMPPFDCECGADTCRGTIRGTDHLQQFVERYGDHVSDYVRRKRERTGEV